MQLNDVVQKLKTIEVFVYNIHYTQICTAIWYYILLFITIINYNLYQLLRGCFGFLITIRSKCQNIYIKK